MSEKKIARGADALGKMMGLLSIIGFSVLSFFVLKAIGGPIIVALFAVFAVLIPFVYRFVSGSSLMWKHEQKIADWLDGDKGCLIQFVAYFILLLVTIAIIMISFGIRF